MDIKDSLKAAGRAIKNSPRTVKRKIAEVKSKQRMKDEWFSSNDAVIAGVTFYVKYLGTVKVTQSQGQGCTDEAVVRILAHAKQRKHAGQKLTKMALTVSSKSMTLVEIATANKLDEIPMYRISYCTTDGRNKKVFSYIARNRDAPDLECHSFVCSSPSKAQAMTLSVAQAFNVAFDTWQQAKARRQAQMEALKKRQEAKDAAGEPQAGAESAAAPAAAAAAAATAGAQAGTLIDVGDQAAAAGTLEDHQVDELADKMADWDMDNDLDAEFSKLAVIRTNPNQLEIGGFGDEFNEEEIMTFQKGEAGPDDLDRTPSHDDLLDF
ncbi:low density lipoprotein receptor adapter protein 1-A-like [Sycon ciliatum]|uniref:low density lipoprotein receptor adapter protein 1-A-like n=1 Tax=Sycon ciliatum TaxID=27933 RepID=UPI0020AE3AFF|eukprot:scpid80447/ scgid25353/ Low density lipoprotein receptor adapter protein 1-A; Autosomal recessive hypercholesterolemia protein homolog alpha; Phosphotyrosine-binding protein; Xcat4